MSYTKESEWSTVQCSSDNKWLFAQDDVTQKFIQVNVKTMRLEHVEVIDSTIAYTISNYASTILYIITWDGRIIVYDIIK